MLSGWVSRLGSVANTWLMSDSGSDESSIDNPQRDVATSASTSAENITNSKDEIKAERQPLVGSCDAKLQDSPYQHTKDVLNASALRYETFLQHALDPKAYQVIQGLKKDEYSRYEIGLTENKALATYKKLHNLFSDLQRFINSLESIHLDAVNLSAKTALGRVVKIGKELVTTLIQGENDNINKHLSQLLIDYFNLFISIAALEPAKAFEAVSSLIAICNTVKGVVLEIVPEEVIKERLTSNAFWAAYNSVNAECNKLLAHPAKIGIFAALTQNKISFKDVLSMFMTELVGTQASLDSLNSYRKCEKALDSVNKLIDSFIKSKQNWHGKIKLVYKLVPAVTKLLEDFPLAYTSLKEVLSTHFLEFAQQVNLLLRDIFLGLNRIEVELFLKDGYLNSLGQPEIKEDKKIILSFAKELNDWVESCGWQFKEEERYPYKHAILKQREELRAAVVNSAVPARSINSLEEKPAKQLEESLNMLSEQLLEARCKSDNESLQLYDCVSAQQKMDQSLALFIQQKNAINTLIDVRIAELKAEIKSAWFSSSIKDEKIRLLRSIKDFLNKPEGGCRYYCLDKMVSQGEIRGLLGEATNDAYVKTADDQLFYVNKNQQGQVQVQSLNILQPQLKDLKTLLKFDETFNGKVLTSQQLQAIGLLTGHHRVQGIDLISIYNRNNELLPKEFKNSLLWSGRTGKLMSEIGYLSANRQDSISIIDDANRKLQQKVKQGFWFFANSRTRRLQSRINALEKLKEWLLIPGYSLEDAFNKLRAKYPSFHNLLYKNDYGVINELKRVEHHIYLRSKKTFESIKIQDGDKLRAKQAIIAKRLKSIDDEIAEIRSSREYWFPEWYIKPLVSHKSALELLQEWLLRRGYELEDVLRVFELKYPKEYSYLLLERKIRKDILAVEASEGVKNNPVHRQEVESLLEQLELELDKLLNKKIKSSARVVLQEGRKLKDKLDDQLFPAQEEINTLAKSLKCALRVVQNPQDQKVISDLKNHARNEADGHPDFWRKFIGALGLLVVATVACLVLAGIPLVAGLSAATLYAGSAGAMAMSLASFGFFYNGCQKGLSRKMDELTETTAEAAVDSNPGVRSH